MDSLDSKEDWVVLLSVDSWCDSLPPVPEGPEGSRSTLSACGPFPDNEALSVFDAGGSIGITALVSGLLSGEDWRIIGPVVHFSASRSAGGVNSGVEPVRGGDVRVEEVEVGLEQGRSRLLLSKPEQSVP